MDRLRSHRWSPSVRLLPHGSRTIGTASEAADWDFGVLSDDVDLPDRSYSGSPRAR